MTLISSQKLSVSTSITGNDYGGFHTTQPASDKSQTAELPNKDASVKGNQMRDVTTCSACTPDPDNLPALDDVLAVSHET